MPITTLWRYFNSLSAIVRTGIICLLVGFILGGLTCRTWRKAIIEETPTEEHGFGWLNEPDHVNQVVSTFPHPYFGDIAKKLIQEAPDKDALLYKVFEKAAGHAWVPHDQNGTGCCVGEGNSGAVEMLGAIQQVLDGNGGHKDISAAAMYGLAREVGGMLHQRGDGAVGADAAKALMTMGAISCEEAGDTNGRDGSAKTHASLAKKWGSTGLPAALKGIAKTHIVKTVSQVRTPEEVRTANVNGYPVTICSNVGFEGRGGFKRDSNGFCYPGGTWPHCMFIAGYRADKRAFLVFQSWGPDAPPGPKSLDQPDGTFWIEWSACQRIVQSGECYALSAFDGYPAQDLPFIIQAPRQRDPFVFLAP